MKFKQASILITFHLFIAIKPLNNQNITAAKQRNKKNRFKEIFFPKKEIFFKYLK